MTFIELFAVVGAITLGSAAQAISGFGFALVAVPLLAMAIPTSSAVVLVTLVGTALSTIAAVRDRSEVDRRLVIQIAAAAVVGMPIGLLALTMLSPRILSFVIAGVVTIFLLLSISRVRWPTGPGPMAATGFISGAALTSTAMNGPPLVAALHALKMPPLRQRATLQAIFALQDVVAISGFAITGQTPGRIWLLALIAVPGTVLGWWLGNRVFRRLTPGASRRIVLAVLVIATVSLTVRAALS